MKAVAAQNARVDDPVYHVILSWPSHESPSDSQAFACGLHAVKAVGMEGHQYVFAIHRDTDNVHLHIAVNRVNPDSFNAVYPDRDYFKLDRAMRELEIKYGWTHDNGPHAVFERGGKKVIDWASTKFDSKGKIPTKAADMERYGAEESLFSYARAEPRKALTAALKNSDLTWQQLHDVLAKYGLALKEKGQGFAIYDLFNDKTTPIKASDMHEQLSKSRLLKRLGDFQNSSPNIKPIIKYNKFVEPKRDPNIREERRQERAEARRKLREQYNDYKKTFVFQRLNTADVKAQFAAIRDESRRKRLLVKTTVSDPAARKAQYSIIAFETLRNRERLKRKLKVEREALKNSPANKRLSYKEWVEKQAALGEQAAISQLRAFAYAEKRKESELSRSFTNNSVNGIKSTEPSEPLAKSESPDVTYRVRRDGAVVYRVNTDKPCFVDHGPYIEILARGESTQKVLAAVMHAREKYGASFDFTGTEAFKRHAISVLVTEQIDVKLKDAAQEAIKREMEGQAEKDRRISRPRR
ncbi:hypothetical protein GCM10009425_40600 [Pseudomonas asuensis]|uniref:Relaxase/mobilization nuclease domain-containing protein n=2 Tax=Pseudomonas asuensis TaxID=1825787 RepID=A0ABQ2H1C0_9PSED|nr:hypothetical protein GCM10009425_40600 [Pseudomonas asuensis]